MAVCTTPLEQALAKLVSRTDLTEAELVREIQFATEQCTNEAILEELKKMNMYFALITNTRI